MESADKLIQDVACFEQRFALIDAKLSPEQQAERVRLLPTITAFSAITKNVKARRDAYYAELAKQKELSETNKTNTIINE